MSKFIATMAAVGRFSPVSGATEKLGIKLNPMGVSGGWANWPWNFDPIWVEKCRGFKSKQTKVKRKTK
jgi:hypothetical protein